MKLCSCPGALYGLALLAFLCHCATAVERRYYIAAVNINWDYTSAGQQRTGSSYKKVVYREYNEGFTQPKKHPLSSGLLGPTLRGQEGDTIVVTFRNMADHPCSIHPHGIAYGKQSEGSLYFDNTSLLEKEDDVILPGQEHTYHWEVTSEVTPMAADPPCITYTYLSHYDIVKDYNTGLIGTMLICKKGTLDSSGKQISFHQEAVLLFGVFDENKSWYSTGDPPQAQNVKYTINGYTNGSIPDLDICAHSKVSWHLLGMSSEPELFSVHFNGQVLLHDGHKTSTVGIISGTATSASMTGLHPGRWLFSSHISRHLEAGLHGYLNIKTCDEYTAPKRRLTIQQKQESQEWTYYIAAEEIIWDYAPNMPENMDGDFRIKYLKQGPQRIGKKYKKAVFTLYKDSTFKERAEDKQRKKELGILGPVIRAQIRDVIKIVFKNKASRPYSIYPHGLTIDKAAEGASYPEGGNQTHGIQPGETYTYTWSVSEEDVPMDSDPRCLTRMYHSAVDIPRDIASGLVGPLLICKSQSLNKKNVQLKADKEQHAMFTVFDENKSWYQDENINTYCSDPKRVKRDDPEFYKSNVMHTINGYVYESGQELGFCNGEIVTWHVSNVGEQDYIQTATFYGHTFELKKREEDMLSLFPMTGETISMNMVNIGVWLLASLNSHDSTKGMRVKFKDLECFRDYVMEYSNYETEYTVWKPAPITEIKKEEPKSVNPSMVDEDTDNYADILGLRTFKNLEDEVEQIDLSVLYFDDGLLPTVESKSSVNLSDKVERIELLPLNLDDALLPTVESKSSVNLADKVERIELLPLDLDDALLPTVESKSSVNLADKVERTELLPLDLDDGLLPTVESKSSVNLSDKVERIELLPLDLDDALLLTVESKSSVNLSDKVERIELLPLDLDDALLPTVESKSSVNLSDKVERIELLPLDLDDALLPTVESKSSVNLADKVERIELLPLDLDDALLPTVESKSSVNLSDKVERIELLPLDLDDALLQTVESKSSVNLSDKVERIELLPLDLDDALLPTVESKSSVNLADKVERIELLPLDLDDALLPTVESKSSVNLADKVELIELLPLDLDDALLPTVESKSSVNLADKVERIELLPLDLDDALLPTVESKSSVNLSDKVERIELLPLDLDDALLPTVESKSSVNLSDKVERIDLLALTDSVISHFPVVERKVRNLPTKPVNETKSVSTNVTLDIQINANISEDSSSSLETESVSGNTTRAPIIETNISHTMNETHRFPTNTIITSSDAPVDESNITMADDNAWLNSPESKPLLSNQTSVNKTVIKEELNVKNSSDKVDGDRDSSGHVFVYNVPSPDSLSNISETQVEEDFVLLDSGHPLEISTDFMTLVDTVQDIVEITENTTGIQELNSTKGNYTSEMLSQINSETESNLSLNLSLRNSTAQSNESESSNATLLDFSLHPESEITENRTSSTNDKMKSHSQISRNASQLFPSDSKENTSFSLGPFNVSSMKDGSESKSEEEVVIYLKNNHSEAILTSHIDPKNEHWGYEGKHELVHMEIPDHMNKYIKDKSAANSNKPKSEKEEKKKKVVHQRVKPRKGHGMKTKKRKEYKPQPRSGFSPRGFGPSVLTPRGTKPVSSEEDLMGKAIVIGVPRRDFDDYELYVPKQGQETDFDGVLDLPEEYEYVEYKDPYSKSADFQNPVLDTTSQHFLKMAGDKNTRTYFISVEEEEWDYAGYGQRRLDKTSQNERPTAFKKVVFRKYLDSTFSIRDIRGEMDEHLGILGPVIKAEVDQTVLVFFRNRASRPYSLHANGVKYLKQMEGLSYDDQSPYWYKQDDAVQPNSTFTYMWTINSKSGPQNNESDCRTWTYYSAVNPEKDINSGLIGPILVCRKGTLATKPVDRREFVLLFMTFDENKSWYYEENKERIERKNRRAIMDPKFQENLKFDAINGIIYSLKGLRMYTNQLAKWHLINMGSPKDLHSVHFHGQTFINKELKDHRQGVYPLLPGGFATLEMLPSKPGLWQLESEVGLSQQRGMQTLFLVLDNVCDHPLGLISGTVKDEHITASDSRGQWYPHLARLHNTGKYNAWSTTKTGQHIQVDFQRPVVISKVATQGARQYLKHNFVMNYTISYSTDKKKWIFYKGDSDTVRKTFEGNSEAYDTKENTFFPPLIGRYVRLHPSHSYNYPTVRLEYFGCELDGCSVPLGMESGLIKDTQITASSVAPSWYSGQWNPWYARLNMQGTINAWQAKNNDIQQWIQVELKDIKKITGIITQGAKSLRKEMFVKAYTLEYSEDGKRWTKYTDDEDYEQKFFQGNTDNNGQVKNYIYPPIFSRFIRIIPKLWQKSITMRIELLGCDFE
ncbi:hypothetical protein ABG768_027638 [Culter alburnus]|uniref:ferroxidase n=1 Tax=Culter alburnus TaxID=194366 RepID=A0AAW2A8R8_CULAL